MLTDSHCHLADAAFSHRLPAVLAEAETAGVHRFIVPATCPADWPAVLALHHDERIRIALGIHPWFAGQAGETDLNRLQQLLRLHPHALIGEIGLDFHPKHLHSNPKPRQSETFIRQLQLAEQLKRPVIIHNLKATAAIVAAIKQTGFSQGGIAHAFSGSPEEARQLIQCGLLIGIGSLLLNPNAKKAHRAAAELPIEALVLETDSPFMLPNQTNTPANVHKIAETAATLRGLSLNEFAAQTEANLNRLLNFS